MKLQLYYPVDDVFITQNFGNPNPFYKDNGINIDTHNGVDFLCKDGEIVRASHSGYAFSSKDNHEGIGVIIRTDKLYEYQGKNVAFKTIYWHLKRVLIKDGQFVSAGEIIGEADNTGLSTGTHLHFGLKPVVLSEADNVWYNLEQNNGLYWAIDPTPYWNGYYAKNIPQIRKIYEGLIPLLKELINRLTIYK